MKNNHFDPIMKQLSEVLKKTFKKEIKDIILFGSRARGDYEPDSDYDIIVLVDKETKELDDKIFELTWKIGFEHNVSISAFVFEKSIFEKDKYEPLFMNVRKEGVLI